MHKKIKKNSFCDGVFVSLFKADGPTTLCSGRRWRGPGAGRDLGASWRAVARAGRWRSPAAPLKAGRWAFGRITTPSMEIGGMPHAG